MQTSLNPLLSNIVRGDRLASSLTFGQFVKAIASFLAPYIAMWGATQAIPTFDLGWRILFPIYMIVAVIAILLLNVTQIEEEKRRWQTVYFRTMHRPAWQTVYPALFHWYHVSCRHRRRYEHYRSEDSDGAHRHGTG